LEQEQRQEARGVPVRLFHHGERLRFPAKLSAPRNFRNPGAFDYRAYLKETASPRWPPRNRQASKSFPDSPAAGLNSGVRGSIAVSFKKFTPCGRLAKRH